jgi:hypothetical protein
MNIEDIHLTKDLLPSKNEGVLVRDHQNNTYQAIFKRTVFTCLHVTKAGKCVIKKLKPEQTLFWTSLKRK